MNVSDPLTTAWLDTSDWGNAKRLVTIAGGRLLWIEEAQAWAHYDGRRWALERGNTEAQRMAHRVIEHIDMEAEALGEIAEDLTALRKRVGEWCTAEIAQKRVDTLRGHAVRSGSAGMTSGMLKQARSFLSASLDDFDVDALAYNVLNGTLRFRQAPPRPPEAQGRWSVTLHDHDPEDRLMQVANVEYDPAAACPFWTTRLAMLTPDAEQLAAFQLLYGYTLTGLTSDQAFYVHQGKGGDGKSATHMALAELHGDYYRHAGVKTFMQGSERGGAEHRSDLVRLKGDIRFVTCDEPKARSVWDGETIKQITGSLVTARGSQERTEITYKPRFKLHVECNIIPRAPSDDKGFRRRFKLYQWRMSLADIEEGEMPLDIVLAQLAAEKSGILNWLVAGAIAWLETRKIPQPSSMSEVLSDFWAESSPLLEWMSEWCDTSDPEAKTPAKDLYANFKAWCEAADADKQVMSATAFGRALRDKHHAVWKDSRGVRWRKGIALRREGLFGEGGTGAAGAPAAAPGPAAGSSGAEAHGEGQPSVASPRADPDDDPGVPY
jgi:putative DNA primase/helicase